MILVLAGETELRLERLSEGGVFEEAKSFDVMVPIITAPPARANETDRDRLRAFIRHRMHTALAGDRMAPGVYRIEFSGEAVVDRWNGEAMIGCVGIPHVSDCGWFACPHPPRR